MSMQGLEAVLDPSAGDWIAGRLDGFGSRVACTVPRGFAACARVLHPVSSWSTTSGQGGTETWTQVCARTGRIPHAVMQWRAISTPAEGVDLPVSSEGRWEEVSVEEGNLAPQALTALLDVLAPSTRDQPCFHALWEGFGWLTGSSATLTAFADSAGRPPPPAPPPAPVPPQLQRALAAPRLSLPGRDHLLFTGPLRAALAMGHQVTDDWFVPQSPSLLWPADRSWCVASEIDFDSTLVAGPSELVDAVLAATGLDAWPVTPESDLGWLADQVNA